MDDNTIKSLDFDAVCLPPDKHIPLHSQSTWELSCVITGEGTRVLGYVSERFSAGDTVLIPPATPHDNTRDYDSSYDYDDYEEDF